VIYGTSSRLNPSGPPAARFFSQDTPGVPGAAERGDGFGRALVAFDDGGFKLAIGAPGEDIGGAAAAGGVNAIYGSSSGLDPFGSPDAQFFTQDSAGVPGAAEAGEAFGTSLAAGNFDVSSDDVAVGVPGEDVSGVGGAGGVNVIYGTSGALDADGSPAAQLFSQASPGVPGDPESRDGFGLGL
jgi:hypothetical protein